MKKIVTFIVLLNCSNSCFINAQNSKPINVIEKNGMKIEWSWAGENLCFQVFAPQKGWVGIGLNSKSGLSGTNLIMGVVRGERTEISDRYISQPGNHQAMESIGGLDLLKNKKGFENENGTTISFQIPSFPKDKFHQKIEKGKTYFMLLAYSMDDDFSHHSMMRTEIKVIF